MSTHTKRWSYREITDSAEQTIRRQIALAAKQEDHFLRTFHISTAFGTFAAWSDLTMGWMRDGDYERLDQLVHSSLSPEASA